MASIVAESVYQISAENYTRLLQSGIKEELNSADAAWALLCSFIILTMHTGFALLEAGCVSSKNVANIMVKNTTNVVLGGLSYWLFGFAFSFGEQTRTWVGTDGDSLDQYYQDPPLSSYSSILNRTMSFTGWGNSDFAFRTDDRVNLGDKAVRYFFQFTFATTTTTIVSGAIAERMKFHSYMIFAFFNTLTYVWPVHWGWASNGWLAQRGFYDFAGTCLVHMCGGVSALIGAIICGPRMHRFEKPEMYTMSSPVTALTGMMMLWWAWLGFNCGSTFGIVHSNWRIAAVVSITTINGSIGGACAGFLISMSTRRGMVSIDLLITSLLGGLVSVTGIASIVTTWEALIIGFIGGCICVGAQLLLVKIKIDDPVGAIPVHLCGGMWGIIAVGLFASSNTGLDADGGSVVGCFHGDNGYQLAIQVAGMCAVGGWAAVVALIILLSLKFSIGVRVNKADELLGADWVEHGIRSMSMMERLEAALEGVEPEQVAGIVRNMSTQYRDENAQHPQNGGGLRVFSVDSGGLEGTRSFQPTGSQSTNTSEFGRQSTGLNNRIRPRLQEYPSEVEDTNTPVKYENGVTELKLN